MKKQLFALTAVFLMACSGGEEHNLHSFKQIDENNRLVWNSIERNTDYLYASSLIPGMKQVVQPFLNRSADILASSSDLYNAISSDINTILEEHNVHIDTIREIHGFKLSIFNQDEVSEPSGFFYDRGEWICSEMEKLFNKLLCQMNITETGEVHQGNKYHKRPEKPMRLYQYKLDLWGWNGRKGLDKLVPLLLIPETDKEGKTAENMFEGLSMIQTLEKLNLMRQRVLMACEIALGSIGETMDEPMYKFNKVYVDVTRSPALVNDSIQLKVFLNAYDSTEVPEVHYIINGDSSRVFRNHFNNVLVPSNARNVKGYISVKERGELKWKPWIYRFR